MSEYGSDIEEWLAIARGWQEMPWEFQRMTAAWELVVRWHRVRVPTDRTDARLRSDLSRALPELDLHNDDRWLAAIKSLIDVCPILRMQGNLTTNASWTISSTDDWSGVVEVLYGVRCNLMKAGKSPDADRDRDVCSRSAEVTTVIVEHLLGATPRT